MQRSRGREAESAGAGSPTLPFDPIQAIPVEYRDGEAPLHQWLSVRLQKQEQARLLAGELRSHEHKFTRGAKLIQLLCKL